MPPIGQIQTVCITFEVSVLLFTRVRGCHLQAELTLNRHDDTGRAAFEVEAVLRRLPHAWRSSAVSTLNGRAAGAGGWTFSRPHSSRKNVAATAWCTTVGVEGSVGAFARTDGSPFFARCILQNSIADPWWTSSLPPAPPPDHTDGSAPYIMYVPLPSVIYIDSLSACAHPHRLSALRPPPVSSHATLLCRRPRRWPGAAHGRWRQGALWRRRRRRRATVRQVRGCPSLGLAHSPPRPPLKAPQARPLYAGADRRVNCWHRPSCISIAPPAPSSSQVLFIRYSMPPPPTPLPPAPPTASALPSATAAAPPPPPASSATPAAGASNTPARAE